MISFIKGVYYLIMNIDKLNYFDIIDCNIINNIIFYLNINELNILELTHKNTELKNVIRHRAKNLRSSAKFFRNLNRYIILKHFEDTFFPMKLVSKFPILDFEPKFMGPTNYIDRIRPQDMKHPIMIGVDIYRRPFICIKYFEDIDSDNEFGIGSSLITVFQRYSDNNRGWIKAGNNTGPILMYETSLLNKFCKKTLIKNIYQLLNGENITMIDHSFKEKEINCFL